MSELIKFNTEEMATKGQTSFNQSYSKGFIELWGLQTRMYNALKKTTQKTAEKSKKTKK